MASKSQLQVWRKDIVKWANDNVYIPSKTGPKKLKLWPYQVEILRECTKVRKNGKNRYSTIAFCFPKRNGKTFLAALILAWKFCLFYDIQAVVASNSREQAASVLFDTFKDMIRMSPRLLELVGADNILDKEVTVPGTHSKVVVLSSSRATAFGYGIDVGAVDEIHATATEDGRGLYDILSSQTGDRDGQILLPSQVSSKLNVLYELYRLAESGEDKSVYFKHIHDEQPSPLVTDEWIETRKKQLLPQQFNAYHLNEWGDALDTLFPEAKVKACFEESCSLPVPAKTLREWEKKYKTRFVIGAGLDKALGYSKHADRTIWSVIAKGNIDGQERYFLIDQKWIKLSDSGSIRSCIKETDETYHLLNAIFEVYQCADLYYWAGSQNIPCELLHPTQGVQTSAFTNLYQIVNEERLKLPKNTPFLENELLRFQVDTTKNVPTFGSIRGHDDTVYSLAWAIHSLRETTLLAGQRRGVDMDKLTGATK